MRLGLSEMRVGLVVNTVFRTRPSWRLSSLSSNTGRPARQQGILGQQTRYIFPSSCLRSLSTMDNPKLVSSLKDNTFDRYYVEYNGFLSNHLSHGLIALHRLGAKDSFIEDFVAWYSKRLEGKKGPTHQSQELAGEEPIPNLRGRRKDYYRILSHYEGLLAVHHGSVGEITRSEFPDLIQGMAGSALHGLIQLGYGIAASNPRMVYEGLAYLHHSYLPLVTSDPVPALSTFGQGPHDVLEVVGKVKQDDELRSFVLSESQADWVKQKNLGGFQDRMVTLLTMRGDALLRYVHDIRLPDTFDLTSHPEDQMEALTKWLLDTSIVLYHVSERRNDFFLLHGVTSCWALQQVLPLVNDVTVSLTAVRVQLAILLAVYVAQGSHGLNLGYLSEPDVAGLSWEDIKTKILGMKIGTDEHVYKLVQVCYDTSQNNTDMKMADVYKRACFTAMEYDLF